MSIGVMLFNPFTGKPRRPEDIESDPRGVLIWDGEEPLKAAAVSADLAAENAKLKTVMIAAAEEIQDHWDAHCDADGYGPANLMRRLEEGIPSQYGYTAGRFAELQSENAELREVLEFIAGHDLNGADDRAKAIICGLFIIKAKKAIHGSQP
jgi:hypothetical protein